MGNEQATVDAIKGMNGMFVGGWCIRVRRSFIPAGTTSSSGGGPLSPSSTSASGSAVSSPASSPARPAHRLPPHSYHPVSQPQQPQPQQWSSPPSHSMSAGPAPATSSFSHWQSAPPSPPQPTTATPQQQHLPSNALPSYRPRYPAATATTPPH
ncbi:hypothetical protein QOT17_009781 [Balamuthia mandrillaris]